MKVETKPTVKQEEKPSIKLEEVAQSVKVKPERIEKEVKACAAFSQHVTDTSEVNSNFKQEFTCF